MRRPSLLFALLLAAPLHGQTRDPQQLLIGDHLRVTYDALRLVPRRGADMQSLAYDSSHVSQREDGVLDFARGDTIVIAAGGGAHRVFLKPQLTKIEVGHKGMPGVRKVVALGLFGAVLGMGAAGLGAKISDGMDNVALPFMDTPAHHADYAKGALIGAGLGVLFAFWRGDERWHAITP